MDEGARQAAEEAAWLSTLFERAELASVICGPGGELRRVNPAAVALIGSETRQLASVVTPGDPGWEHLWGAMARREGRFHGDVMLRGRDRPLAIDATRVSVEGEPLVVALTFRDTQQRLDAEQDLRLRARQHALIARLGTAALAGAGLLELVEAAVSGLAASLGVDYVGVWRDDEDGLRLVAGAGWPLASVGAAVAPPGEGSHVGYVMAGGRTVALPDLRAEHRFRADPLALDAGVVSGLATPVGRPPASWGVLAVHACTHHAFRVQDAHLLQAVANLLGTAAERERAEAERRRAERQLERAQRLETVGQLAGGIAHDFNNLLAVVLNCARFALQEIPEGTEAYDDVEQIIEASRRASALTRQLLIFSRRDRAEPVVVQVDAVVRSVQRILERAIGDGVGLALELPEESRPVLVDPGQIEQVLMNLAVNARDAIGAGTGVVRLVVRDRLVEPGDLAHLPGLSTGPHVELRVEDDGGGMAPDVAARVFEPFFTTKDVGEGTGLGLATVYGIVNEAGGHVAVSSQEGVGTVFTILIPATSVTVLEEGAQPKRGELAGAGQRVLVAEDDPLVRGVIRRILRGAGYEVTAVADGEAASACARDATPGYALLVTDLMMPRQTGWELARSLCPARVPRVLLVTGHAPEFEHATDLAHAPLLRKPFTGDELLEAVRTCLDAPPWSELRSETHE